MVNISMDIKAIVRLSETRLDQIVIARQYMHREDRIRGTNARGGTFCIPNL